MDRRKVRIVLDAAMSILLVFEMLALITGNTLHEIGGLLLFITIGAHIGLSFSWVRATRLAMSKGKLTPRRRGLAIVGSLLALDTLCLAVSSVAISRKLYELGFRFPFGSYGMWATLHTLSAYALCGLVVVHLAMHWEYLAALHQIPYDASRRRAIGLGIGAAASAGIALLGATAAKSILTREGYGVATKNDGGATSNGEGSATSGGSDPLKNTTTKTDGDSTTEKETTSQDQSDSSAQKDSTTDENDGTTSNRTTNTNKRSSKRRRKQTSDSGQTTQNDSGSSGSTSQEAPTQNDTSQQETTETTVATGNCPLCHNHCPLSNPGCNRPYEAGLIS